MADPALAYEVHPGGGPLRQGEVVSDVAETRLAVTSVAAIRNAAAPLDVKFKFHALAIVVSQDCDLQQDWTQRASQQPNEHKLLPNVLLCEANLADLVRPTLQSEHAVNTKAWKVLRQNRDPRFHFLQTVPMAFDLQGTGLGAVCVEFSRYFTVPTAVLYAQLDPPANAGNRALRRVIMRSPYFEHVTTRFSNYLARIGLPQDHAIGGDDDS